MIKFIDPMIKIYIYAWCKIILLVYVRQNLFYILLYIYSLRLFRKLILIKCDKWGTSI